MSILKVKNIQMNLLHVFAFLFEVWMKKIEHNKIYCLGVGSLFETDDIINMQSIYNKSTKKHRNQSKNAEKR